MTEEPKARAEAALTRREFARRAAVGAAAAALAPGAVAATAGLSAVAAEVGIAQQDVKLSAESQAEADAKIAAILRKYGSRFSEAQKADIRRLVMEGQKPLETMRAFALDNADQPANVMRIYPDAGATGVARR
jgi:hypothetical protein